MLPVDKSFNHKLSLHQMEPEHESKQTQTQRGEYTSSYTSPTPHLRSPSFQRYRGEVTAIACAGVLKGSTSAPFFCHAEINNRWFVFNAQFPLYYYRQCSNGLGLRQSSHDSLSLFLSLFFHPLWLFFCSMPNGLHKCCMHVKQHLIMESLLWLLVRAWKNGRVCFGFSVQTLKQKWNMSLTLLKIHLWRAVERSVNILGDILGSAPTAEGKSWAFCLRSTKQRESLQESLQKLTEIQSDVVLSALIFLWMFSELMFIQIGWNITPQTIKGPFKFCSASCTLVGFLWCHLSNFIPFSNTFVKIDQSQNEKRFQTHVVLLLALKKTGENDTLFNQA